MVFSCAKGICISVQLYGNCCWLQCCGFFLVVRNWSCYGHLSLCCVLNCFFHSIEWLVRLGFLWLVNMTNLSSAGLRFLGALDCKGMGPYLGSFSSRRLYPTSLEMGHYLYSRKLKLYRPTSRLVLAAWVLQYIGLIKHQINNIMPFNPSESNTFCDVCRKRGLGEKGRENLQYCETKVHSEWPQKLWSTQHSVTITASVGGP